jgi:hypothetical protein
VRVGVRVWVGARVGARVKVAARVGARVGVKVAAGGGGVGKRGRRRGVAGVWQGPCVRGRGRR